MAEEAPTSIDPPASGRAFELARDAGRTVSGTTLPSAVGAPNTSTSKVRGFIREARPRQWAKNVLVAAAPAAAGVLTHRDALIDTLIAFVAFCLAASGTYFLNDALDAEADRLHPK